MKLSIPVLGARRVALVAVLAMVASVCAVAVLVTAGDAESNRSQDGAALPAATNIAALGASATTLTALPEGLDTLPTGLRPLPGTVHRLLSRSDGAPFDLDAWHTDAGRVCKQTSRGSGGCFDAFAPGEYLSVTISDSDRLGAGSPAHIWGVVPDVVAAVDVVISGTRHRALLKNNAVYLELPDSALLPEVVERFVVTLKGGGEQLIEA